MFHLSMLFFFFNLLNLSVLFDIMRKKFWVFVYMIHVLPKVLVFNANDEDLTFECQYLIYMCSNFNLSYMSIYELQKEKDLDAPLVLVLDFLFPQDWKKNKSGLNLGELFVRTKAFSMRVRESQREESRDGFLLSDIYICLINHINSPHAH